MARAFIIVLDSVGIGASADANHYGDRGADTLRHVAQYCEAGKANQVGVRSGCLAVPNLVRLGLNEAASISQGHPLPGVKQAAIVEGMFGAAKELSHGKDTQSGHWEMTGVPVLFDWGYFKGTPSFPEKLLLELINQAALPGVIGNKHASGTEIINELGEEHQKSGKPIVYTSGDSVFQIAAHEESFGLERLYKTCLIARELVNPYRIGRVIARPFVGTYPQYLRTYNRRDYAIPPPAPTLLDAIIQAQGTVTAIGKISDIFAGHGISKSIKADGNNALFNALIAEAKIAPDHSLSFVNLIDFDMVYGHRRDVIGYAKALEEFDAQIPELEQQLKAGDLVIITADHGCDPTWPGYDHTREHIPIIIFGPAVKKPGSIGLRESFADIGQSIAKHLGIPALSHGTSFL